ncbi:Fcf2-domain-containing protein [Annulohypoxylon maeteangense]|uniref:Fcf2-domain-containing protein n=1 Tax=Annulohypoxylon maeteangense TaxID=1927788 RepID=UPI002008658A|nr:Fcf2-domain-containing protein [Annulohypoxylon maeteangense]KAI0887089.1 Fcf2-domain-containing protein [Annulohypoxylon maeteangense]
MADTTTIVDLSDDQIEQLLKEAEIRLQAKCQGQDSKAVAIPSKSDVAKTSKPQASLLKSAPLTSKDNAKSEELSVRIPEVRRSKQEMAVKTDAGSSWFNLPKTDLTPELKKDLQLLRMRDVLDSKRFYRKDSSRSLVPEFSSVGTIVEGPTDFFNARLTKKERKRTLLEEVLETEDITRKFKNKYGQIQETKASGKKGHYKKMMAKRYGNKR